MSDINQQFKWAKSSDVLDQVPDDSKQNLSKKAMYDEDESELYGLVQRITSGF